MGFYVLTEGRIMIDGINMQDFGLRSLRSGIGLVSQDPFIFTGSAAARC
jgi:ABC-type multidrug transport system fused ATPase/permease subunit